MLHLEGDKTFTQNRDLVYAKLTDLRFLVKCLPDLHEIKEVKDKTASVLLRPGFTFVRGEMHLSIEKLEASEASSAKFLLHTRGIGSSSEVETTFRLFDQGSGATLHYALEIKQLGGLLKAVPQGLIHGGAQRVVGDLLNNVERRLSMQL